MAPRKLSKSAISAPKPTTVTATAHIFQLPALNIPRTSLTEGTSIPAPQREPTPPISPPQTPLSIDSLNPLRSHPTASSLNLTRKLSGDATKQLNGRNGTASPQSTRSQTGLASSTMGNVPGKRSYTPSPASTSPPPAKRPHIRKLLSLKSLANLNRSSAELSNTHPYPQSGYSVDIRSQSPSPTTSTSMSTLSKLRRRGSGMFWRRTSSFGLGNVNEEGEPMDTHGQRAPPPTLPEIDAIEDAPETDSNNTKKPGGPSIRRQPSGWFGGAKIFDGIGQRQ